MAISCQGLRAITVPFVADLDPALAVPLEPERRAQGGACLALGAKGRAWKQLAVMFRQQWIGVKGAHLRRPAIHEQVDDLPRSRGKVGRLRR
jgi:hypothetical protein